VGLLIGLLHKNESGFEKDITVRLIHSTVQQDLTYWPRVRRIHVTCYKHGREMHREFWWESPDQKDHLEEKNSVALVRKLTIPIEPSPHVGEVSTNFSG
jgi:hypothetical protein